jgi:23S rRNA C2498 (ribose-2'-O)-methylase RlmM
MEQLAIRQTYDVVAHVRFEIVELENDWIDWCTECAINLKLPMEHERQVKKGKMVLHIR